MKLKSGVLLSANNATLMPHMCDTTLVSDNTILWWLMSVRSLKLLAH